MVNLDVTKIYSTDSLVSTFASLTAFTFSEEKSDEKKKGYKQC